MLQERLFLFATVFVALLLHVLPIPQWASYFWPDWVVLTLLSWCMIRPGCCSIGVCWVFGLVVDMMEISPLGQHALIFIVTAYVVVVVNYFVASRLGGAVSVFISVFVGISGFYTLSAWAHSFFFPNQFDWITLVKIAVDMVVWLWMYDLLRFSCAFLSFKKLV